MSMSDGGARAWDMVEAVSTVFSHALRGPIASMAGAIDLLISTGDEGQRQEIGRLAGDRLRDLRALVDGFVRLIRPVEEEVGTTTVSALMSSVSRALQAQPADRRLRLEIGRARETTSIAVRVAFLRDAVADLVRLVTRPGGAAASLSEVPSHRTALLQLATPGSEACSARLMRVLQDPSAAESPLDALRWALIRRAVETSGGVIAVAQVPESLALTLELPAADAAGDTTGLGSE